MAVTVKEIRDYKEYLVKNLYHEVRLEQELDRTYIDDTFVVPEVKNPHHLYRSGFGVRIVDAPAEQIVTSNPQAFVTIHKGSQEASERLGEVINQRWVDILRRQNPNPFKENIKDGLGRGEFFIKVVHKEDWVTSNPDKMGLPVVFMILDPMVIYASPEEDDNGIPLRIMVIYQRQTKDLIVRYPDWQDNARKLGKAIGDNVEWVEYWDKEERYIEADEVAITNGVEPNLYKFPPFVRKYSGFGRRSPTGNLSNLIVSDIRRSRDLLREECAMRSNIASVEYLFAHQNANITMPEQGLDETKAATEISFGAYDVNLLPFGTKIDFMDIRPNPESFKHHADIVAELNQRHPFVMAGFPFGSSGRQQDMTQTHAMRRYDSIVENAENAWGTAFEMALKICDRVPKLKPDYLRKDDLKTTFEIEVKLKAKDPIEEDRKITLGDRLWNAGRGSISLKTFHVEYQGMTEDESKTEIANMLADQLTIYNPEIAQLLGSVSAQEGGLERWLEQLRQIPGAEGGGLQEPLSQNAERRIQGEVQTPQGDEEASPRGARVPPVRSR